MEVKKFSIQAIRFGAISKPKFYVPPNYVQWGWCSTQFLVGPGIQIVQRDEGQGEDGRESTVVRRQAKER